MWKRPLWRALEAFQDAPSRPKKWLQLKSRVTSQCPPLLRLTTAVRSRTAVFWGRECEAAAQAALPSGWLARGRMVGGDGVCYRRRIQQAAHYVLNDTIVKSLASCNTEVERGVNMSGTFGNIKATKRRLFWTRMICSVSNADFFSNLSSNESHPRDFCLRVLYFGYNVKGSRCCEHISIAQWRTAEGWSVIVNVREGCAEQTWPPGLLLFGNFSKQMQILQLLF